MIEDLRVVQRNHMAFIGDNAVDIVLYISKILSYQYKVLVYDRSSAGMLLNIISLDGDSEFQNIHYASSESTTELSHSYDIIITFSDTLQNIPESLLSGDVYIIISPGKYGFKKIFKEFKNLNSEQDNTFIVCRGNHYPDLVIKKLYLSEIAPYNNGRMFFICDNQCDSYVKFNMEYNSVFLYERLSKDLKKFLDFIYNRVLEMFDIASTSCLSDEIRFKWVM